MCIRDSSYTGVEDYTDISTTTDFTIESGKTYELSFDISNAVSYTHLRAHETVLDLVCRLLLEKKKKKKIQEHNIIIHQTLKLKEHNNKPTT